jgi:hypothetical protein
MLDKLFRKKQPAQPANPAHIESRTQLLNLLASAYGYGRYLEIGVRNPADNFAHVAIADKVSVDPDPRAKATFPMTSDAFFREVATPRGLMFDLVFIDGLHLAEQVVKDVENALGSLLPGGTLVLHDVNPLSEEAQVERYELGKVWNGTVWKAWAELRGTRPDLSMCVVDIDHGCGVIRPGAQRCYAGWPSAEPLAYQHLAADRKALLNLVSVGEFLELERPLQAARLAR